MVAGQLPTAWGAIEDCDPDAGVTLVWVSHEAHEGAQVAATNALEAKLGDEERLRQSAEKQLAAETKARRAAEKQLASLRSQGSAERNPTPKAPRKAAPRSVYYKNCDAVRAAGAAPIHAGEPGYGLHLDSDGDGVGCEKP
jgi:hypothetical protein